jgi:hypothetical protein
MQRFLHLFLAWFIVVCWQSYDGGQGRACALWSRIAKQKSVRIKYDNPPVKQWKLSSRLGNIPGNWPLKIKFILLTLNEVITDTERKSLIFSLISGFWLPMMGIHYLLWKTDCEKIEVARPLLFCRFARLPRLEFELKMYFIHSNVCVCVISLDDPDEWSSIVNITHFNWLHNFIAIFVWSSSNTTHLNDFVTSFLSLFV